MRLLIPDEMVRQVNIRTLQELVCFWQANHGGINLVLDG